MGNRSYNITIPKYTQNNTGEGSFLETLIAATANLLDIDSTELYIKGRRHRVKFGRWFVWEIMIAHRGFSLAECTRIFGHFDHTTIIHGITQLPRDLKDNELLSAIYVNLLKKLDLDMDKIIALREKRDFYKKDRLIRRSKIFIV